MKRQLIALSRRAASSSVSAQPYVCRRCLAQAAASPSAKDDFISPSSVPQQSQDLPTLTPVTPLNAVSTITTQLQHSTLSAGTRAGFAERYLTDSKGADRKERERLLAILRKDLEHDLPSQYLTHIDPAVLTRKETKQREHLYKWAMTGHVDNEGRPKSGNARELKGVVVSAGLMDRTVKVRIPGQRWEPRIKRYYATHKDHLVSDPNNSLLEGDIVILHRLHVAKTVHHVVGSVAVPYGKPLDQRPHIYTPEERLALYKEQRLAKAYRNKLRNKIRTGDEDALQELKGLGVDATALLPKIKSTKRPSEEFTVGAKAVEKKNKYDEQSANNVRDAKEKLDDLHKAGLDTPNKLA